MNRLEPPLELRGPPGVIASPQTWIWSALTISVLICGVVSWLHFEQRATAQRAWLDVQSIAQVRIDLGQGFLHATASTASERAGGLSLLQRAMSSIERLASIDSSRASRRDLQQRATQFSEQLQRWSANPASPSDAALRDAFQQLVLEAERADAEARNQLQLLLQHQRTVFGWGLGAALALLALICAAVFTLSRARAGSQARQAERERRDADEALRRSEARFRATFEHAAVGIAHVALDGRFLAVNQKLCDVVGYSREELQSKTFQDITHPQDLATDRAFSQRAQAGEIDSYASEKRYIGKDGNVVWANRTAALVRNADSTPDYYITVIEDIQKRKQAEEALRHSERRFRALIEHSLDSIAVIDAKNQILYLSPAVATVEGYGPEELLGRSGIENTHPDDLPLLDAIVQQLLANPGKPVPVLWRRRHKDGRWIWLEGFATNLLDDPAVRGIVTNYHDVTERKQAEQALASERALLRTLVDALPDVVFTKDQVGRFTMGNAAAIRHSGFSREEDLAGKTVFDLYPRELAEMYHADDLRTLHGESILNREEPGVDADGNARWFLTIKVPLRNPAGEIIGLVGMSRDITDRKNAEALSRRTQKMEALGTLAGGIAHDFNNILLAINGNARLAIADLAADHPAQESLSEIAKAGARAADLVRRILVFSRPQESRRETMQLQPVIEEALKLLRSTLPAMVEIRSAFAGNVPAVSADASQIHQIIMNLATNAAHAIGDQVGLVEIGLEAADVSAQLLHASIDLREGRYVRLAVSDNGCGMDPAMLERIFDPFFTTKPAGQGTGLGLSVVHGIMRGHGGAVTVYSQPGKGTTFHLYFPAANAEGRVDEGGQREVARVRTERVLYVDDEAALVLLARRALERLGYQVTGHHDPAQALQDFKARPDAFDVVVTDLSMPGMSGFELARAVLATRPDIPLLMTSGYVREQDEDTARKIGVRAVILKPSTADDLGKVLDRVFQGREI